MSDERRETVDFAYIGRALQRLTAEVAGLREQMDVQTAIILRHETMLKGLNETMGGILEQITAMVRQNARIVDRLRTIEARVDAIEGAPRE